MAVLFLRANPHPNLVIWGVQLFGVLKDSQLDLMGTCKHALIKNIATANPHKTVAKNSPTEKPQNESFSAFPASSMMGVLVVLLRLRLATTFCDFCFQLLFPTPFSVSLFFFCLCLSFSLSHPRSCIFRAESSLALSAHSCQCSGHIAAYKCKLSSKIAFQHTQRRLREHISPE